MLAFENAFGVQVPTADPMGMRSAIGLLIQHRVLDNAEVRNASIPFRTHALCVK